MKLFAVLLSILTTACASRGALHLAMSPNRAGLSSTDSKIVDAVLPASHYDTLTLAAQLVSTPAPRDWVALWEKSHTPEMFEDVYQAMLLHEDDRYHETLFKRFGVQNVGKNKAHPLEKESLIFWMTADALHTWQLNPEDTSAKARALTGLQRLKALEQKNEHTKWMIFRLQELNGETPEGDYPKGYRRWRFTERTGGYGSYKLYEPRSNLRWQVGHDKMGGYIGKTVSAACLMMFIFSCKPMGWADWTLRSVGWDANVTIFNESGAEIRIKHQKATPNRGMEP
jgi:hypothetical protein